MEADGAGEKLIEAGVLQTQAGVPIEEKLKSIAADTGAAIERFRPDIVAVEELYSHYRHPKTAILMGHARGVILQRCAEAHIKIRSFSATRIKKSITGNGRASKRQVQKTIQTILGLEQLPEPSDVADAIAVAICCANTVRVSTLQGL